MFFSFKGLLSPGSLGSTPSPGRILLDSAASMLHSYQIEMSSLTFKILQSGKYHLIFFNEHRNKTYWHYKYMKKVTKSHFFIGSDRLL